MKALQPAVKWSGSKRHQAAAIAPIIRSRCVGTYFEPFLGGAAILGALGPLRSVGSDVQPELMALWRRIQSDPASVAKRYEESWSRLQLEGHEYFYKIRDHFNSTRSPDSLLFLSRTCVNGLIRFNSAGDFNNSFHHTRPGIRPDRLQRIFLDWSQAISRTKFMCTDYEEAVESVGVNDFVYLDPPYMHNKGRYGPEPFDFNRLWLTLDRLSARGAYWLLSIDGFSGTRDYRSALEEVESRGKASRLIASGNSPFPRTQGGKSEAVMESLYANFEF